MPQHKTQHSTAGPTPAHHRPSAKTVAPPHPAVVMRQAQANPGSLTPGDIIQLQRTIGNRAVGQLLQRARQSHAAPPIQAKLTVGPAHDPFEQEADRVAEQVTSMPSAPPPVQRDDLDEEETLQGKRLDAIQRLGPEEDELLQGKRLDAIQRAGGDGSFEVDEGFQSQLDGSKGGGSPLPTTLRRDFEPKFGADFSGVRVHTGGQASAMNAQIQAKAFTHGSDIYFGGGHYSPDTGAGKKLLAHELTHTLQQGAVSPVQRGPLEEEVQTKPLDPIQRLEGVGEDEDEVAQPKRLAESTPPDIQKQNKEGVIQRAVGFEFEDASWTVFQKQPGRKFRRPKKFKLFKPGTWDRGNVARPGSEKTEDEEHAEEYSGQNIWQTGGGGGDSHVNNKLGTFNLQTPLKKGTLHEGADFHIEPDGPYTKGAFSGTMNMELVTEPFPETPDGRERLNAALNEMIEIYNRLNTRVQGTWAGGDLQYDNFVTPAQHGFSKPNIYLYGGVQGGQIKAQATSGVDMSDLPEIMQTLGIRDDETVAETERRTPVRQAVFGRSDPQELRDRSSVMVAMGNAPAYAQEALDTLRNAGLLNEDDDKAALKGFLAQAILIMTMLSASTNEGIKIAMPLLPRFSLAVLFSKLPPVIQNVLQDRPDLLIGALHDVVQRSIYQYLAHYLRLRNITNMSFANTRSQPGMNGPMVTPLLGSSLAGEGGENQQGLTLTVGSFTRAQWIQELLNGRDLLNINDLIAHIEEHGTEEQQQAMEGYGKSAAIFLRGYGNTKTVKNVEGENTDTLALFENRNIPAINLTIQQAADITRTYFDWLVAVKGAHNENPEPLIEEVD